jgi:hypothetical protein
VLLKETVQHEQLLERISMYWFLGNAWSVTTFGVWITQCDNVQEFSPWDTKKLLSVELNVLNL